MILYKTVLSVAFKIMTSAVSKYIADKFLESDASCSFCAFR